MKILIWRISILLERNEKVRLALIQLLDGITDEQFNVKSSQNAWSPKEIIDHLVKMERTITSGIRHQLTIPDSPRAMKKPIQISTLLIVKVKAPAHTAPTSEYKTKVEMKIELHHTRMELISVYKSSNMETLKMKSFKHPIFGQIPLIQWFPFLDYMKKGI
ncbi:DinB family protein [Psychrobacillus vulpis]|uniref:DinB family protein n=1 Tax=Psychrobacillus vulpis TaxID=2325572 RepID=UPI001F1091DC|nr:DinB family protein [Psychrobacillus vulpis]